MAQKTVMVLGAGLAGLGAARRALESNFKVTVYEKADQIGGLWYYKDDLDHNCVYDGVLTNQPKEVNQLPDFYYSDQTKWYFNAQEVQEYLVAYAKKSNVDKLVQLNHEVVDVRPAKESESDTDWEVTVKDLMTGDILKKSFDFVAICNGHYSLPNMVPVTGQERFKGEVLHSVKFRRADAYKGKRVLVIGSGLSAMDIVVLLTKEAAQVYFSQRTLYSLDFEKPDNLVICSLAKEITETGAIFTDGKSCEVDTIIYATGYKFNFPFLHASCGIVVEDDHIQDLYKHTINIRYPTMALIGMPFLVLTTLLFDLQSQFVVKCWSAEKPLASKDEMLDEAKAELQKRLDLGWPRRHAHKMMTLSKDYHDDLADSAGVERTKKVCYEIVKYFIPRSHGDFLNYRKECYEIIDDESFRTYWK